MKTLRQQIAEELGSLADSVHHYFVAGVPVKCHERDIENQIAASSQCILDLLPPDVQGESEPAQISEHFVPPQVFTHIPSANSNAGNIDDSGVL